MPNLKNLRVLVVEDELLIALALEDMLQGFGCNVVGPFSRIADAERAIRSEPIDAALLDVNVRGELVYPIAAMLAERGIPSILCSGYAASNMIPDAFKQMPQIAKPYDEAILRRMMDRVFLGTAAASNAERHPQGSSGSGSRAGASAAS
jgi:DNA-binding NtrC family response regulator